MQVALRAATVLDSCTSPSACCRAQDNTSAWVSLTALTAVLVPEQGIWTLCPVPCERGLCKAVPLLHQQLLSHLPALQVIAIPLHELRRLHRPHNASELARTGLLVLQSDDVELALSFCYPESSDLLQAVH